MVASSEMSRTPPETTEKVEQLTEVHLENVKTSERVPGHPGYYEQGGLRTYGDGLDHDHEPPVCPTIDIGANWPKLMHFR